MDDLYAKCINDSNNIPMVDFPLTLNKIYKVVVFSGFSEFISVIDDNGNSNHYFTKRFEIIDWGKKFTDTIDK